MRRSAHTGLVSGLGMVLAAVWLAGCTAGNASPDPASGATAVEERADGELCEHGLSLVECAKCRFEAGVVAVGPEVAGRLVRVAEVKQQACGESLRLLCEVAEDGTKAVEVVAPAAGRVVAVEARLGELLPSGKVLMRLESPARAAALEESKRAGGELRNARFGLERLEKSQTGLKVLLERLKTPPAAGKEAAPLDASDLWVGEEKGSLVGAANTYFRAEREARQTAALTGSARRLVGRAKAGGDSTGVRGLAVGTWKGEVLESSARLRAAGKAYEREKELTDQGVSSRAELEQAEAELEIARSRFAAAIEAVEMEAKQRDVQAVADLETARAELQALVEGSLIEMEARHQAAVAALELAEAADAAAGSRLSYLGLVDAQGRAAGADLTVPAPIGGTVLRLDVAVGSVVSEGQAVARVADLSSVWAWCDLFPDTLSRLDAISLPLEAALTVTGAGEQAFPGRLDFITSGTAEPGHTVRARIVLDNRPGRLRPGLAAAAVVTLPSRGLVSVVPASAVLEDGGVRFVFSWWKGDLWRRQDVEMGPRVGDDVVITRGLVPGDKVVAQGGFLLKSDILREKMGAGCAD